MSTINHTVRGEHGGYTVRPARTGGYTVDMWSRVAGAVTGDRWHVADDQVIGCDPDQIAAVARERGTCLRRGIVVR
jgi:hypothetical protein